MALLALNVKINTILNKEVFILDIYLVLVNRYASQCVIEA